MARPALRGRAGLRSDSRRRFFFRRRSASAVIARARCDDHFGEDLDNGLGGIASIGRLSATMPPKALTGSQRKACS